MYFWGLETGYDVEPNFYSDNSKYYLHTRASLGIQIKGAWSEVVYKNNTLIYRKSMIRGKSAR